MNFFKWTNGAVLALSLSLSLSLSSVVHATPVSVGYTATGTAGNWILDFSVTNNVIAGQDIYFFGINLSARDIAGSPAGFNPNAWFLWDNCALGGSCTNTYNNNWMGTPIVFGQTTSGFKVHIADLVVPASVSWFSYAYGNVAYAGPGCNNCGYNPGFSNHTASLQQVPEPATMALLGMGLLGLTYCRKQA